MIKREFQQIGRYKILEEIGRGGMGVVYKAYDPVIERTVALKMIRFQDFTEPSEIEELKIRLRQEVKAAGKLSHPNIVMIYDVEEEGGNFAIVMEYVDGDSLDKILKKQKAISLEESIRIIQKVCDALDYAHKQGIVHRDVKPANIIITKNGEPKLMDFGIAKLADSTVTKTGSALGTPSYTAPEMIKGEKVDARADIFSLGCVFYEMLTGERAFPGENITPIMYKILEEEPTPPVQLNKKLPPAVNSIIFKSLAKDLVERYQTAEEFAGDLATLVSHPEAISALKIRKGIRLERLFLPLGAGMIGVLIVILFVLFVPQLFRGEVSKVEWVENILYAKSENDKEVWKKVFDAEIGTALVSDINNDGRNEVVVGTKSRKSSKGSYGEVQGRIYLLDAKGRKIWKVNVGVPNAYRDFDDKYSVYSLLIEDVDNDRYKDIISLSSRAPWFPTLLLIQYGSKDLKVRKKGEYLHPGIIRIERIEEINNNGYLDLICVGVNNDLGSRSVIFALDGYSLGFIHQSPPWSSNKGSQGIELWYIPLGGRDIINSVTKLKTEDMYEVGTARGKIFLDFYGNILNGPWPLPHNESENRMRIRKEIYENWQIAREFSRNKSNELAINKLKEAINLKGDNPYLLSVLYFELGNLYLQIHKYSEAINVFKKSLEIDSRFYYGYSTLGRTYWLLERNNEAVDLFIKAFALLKDGWEGGWIYRDLMQSYIIIGDIERVKELCMRCDEVSHYWVGLSKTGDVYTLTGKFHDAIQFYRECLSMDSINSYNLVFEGLAKDYAYLDTNLEEAEKMITDAIKEDPESDSSLSGTLGWIHFKQAKQGKGNYENALNEVKKAIAYYSNENHPIQIYRPTLAELYFFLANIYEAMGKIEESSENYKECLKLNRGDTYIKKVAQERLKIAKEHN
ncbi:MAG: protein kinase [candidate division WOR-3 bacterium]